MFSRTQSSRGRLRAMAVAVGATCFAFAANAFAADLVWNPVEDGGYEFNNNDPYTDDPLNSNFHLQGDSTKAATSPGRATYGIWAGFDFYRDTVVDRNLLAGVSPQHYANYLPDADMVDPPAGFYHQDGTYNNIKANPSHTPGAGTAQDRQPYMFLGGNWNIADGNNPPWLLAERSGPQLR